MRFDSSEALRRATGRAKSDVANKLVSMFLHEFSRRVCEAAGGTVSSSEYQAAVVNAFGHRCVYCSGDLERDRAAVEHLDGMNRFRVGLHVPGNVALSCRRCNSEKRRDDQKPRLHLAQSGWGSFLSHDGSRCDAACKTCHYWDSIWKDSEQRTAHLQKVRARILSFRQPFARFLLWSDGDPLHVRAKLESLYRSCQSFATSEIDRLITELNFDFELLKQHRVKPSA